MIVSQVYFWLCGLVFLVVGCAESCALLLFARFRPSARSILCRIGAVEQAGVFSECSRLEDIGAQLSVLISLRHLQWIGYSKHVKR